MPKENQITHYNSYFGVNDNNVPEILQEEVKDDTNNIDRKRRQAD